MLGEDDFLNYGAQGYTLVPLWRAIELPGVSPLAVYRQLADAGDDYLFETGAHHHDGFSRHLSVIGLRCDERIELFDQRVRVIRGGRVACDESCADPLGALQRLRAQWRVPRIDVLPAYSGGLFGYFGFETTRLIEPRLARQPRKAALIDVPDVVQLLSKELVVFDHRRGLVFAIVHGTPDGPEGFRQAAARLDTLVSRLLALPLDSELPAATAKAPAVDAYSALEFKFPRRDFEAAVEQVKDYIKAGDVMQVVLSQRMTRPLNCSAAELYRALTTLSRTPYSYLINLGDCHVVGASPEMLVRQQAGKVVSRPMAGTRRRGESADEDRRLKEELLADPKEIAEHMMLVDLARNDLGRVADVGSVTVDESLVVEHFSHVMHIVSTVTGQVPPQVDGIDVLKSTFPAGTLSGASKIRALEVINELEPYARGVYGGAVGYLDWHGNADLAITIRTGVIHHGQLHIQAGAGVVLDSRPEREWQETMEKSRVLVLAAAQAEAQHAAGQRIQAQQ